MTDPVRRKRVILVVMAPLVNVVAAATSRAHARVLPLTR